MRFVITAGPDKGRTDDLPATGAVTFGRGTDLPTPLTDPHVSRRHCEVTVKGGIVTVTDCESRGGTFVNGRQVKTAVLKPGDVLRLGETELKFELQTAATGDATLGTMPPKSAGEPVSDDLSGLVGTRIHNYLLERVLARGTTGWVFYARHSKHDRELAVKVLYPSITKVEEETQRFIRAMKTMFPLKHPHIVQLYNAGIHKPYCWLAMEYVNGEPLTEIIRRIGMAGMLSWEYAFKVAVQTARALEAASEQNIIHRNVSPSSILIRKADQAVKLGDLMLAKAIEGLDVEHITKPGEIVGDISYMSPERTVGPDGVDTRSDVYGLGATLYAVLTGRPPFEAPSLPALILKIRNDEPAKPKTFQLSINDMFQGVVMRCLAKRPEDRYQSPTSLLVDLNRVAKFAGITV